MTRATCRIATYNIAWFASLFNANDALLRDNGWSGRRDVTRSAQIDAIATVLRAIDADILLIVEAPDTGRRNSCVAALETYARTFGLRQRRAVTGFPNGTQQELALLFDPDLFTAHHDPKGIPNDGTTPAEGVPRFDGRFRWDVDIDGQPDLHVFSKPPLEAAITHVPSRTALRLIGVHAKSKAPHGAKTPKDAARIAITNRRKQLAQCIWLRARIDTHLDSGDRLIVLGDLNDGPGLDAYEALFGRSGVEIVMGDPNAPERLMTDPNALAAHTPRQGWRPSTARFFNHRRGTFLNALLDYIFLSPMINDDSAPQWRIWHPFDDPACFADQDLSRALLTASDHFPVTVDLALDSA